MTKTEKAALVTMTPDELIEKFIQESKLVELADVDRANEAVDQAEAYADEIRRRGGLPSLAPLLRCSDPFIAYSVARHLAHVSGFSEEALEVLDRIADGKLGFASDRANTARNMIRFGNRLGDPVEVEKKLAEIRSRRPRG